MPYNYISELKDCAICPRECHADRLKGRSGYCHADHSFDISAICRHTGEEPVISGRNGICNVFFAHCNMQCIYCQNYQISRNRKKIVGNRMTLYEIVCEISALLDSGIDKLGFVSPSHFIPQMIAIITALKEQKRKPVIVYNSNSYDKVKTLKTLENIVDVFLPDFKYADAKLAVEYSDAPGYPDIALKAIKEMVRQKGTSLRLNDEGQVESGVIIRHLILPGHVENSINVMRLIAGEISPSVHISLMSQYYPTPDVSDHPVISRTLKAEEYETIVKEMTSLELHRGWLQEFESHINYRPDFFRDKPFT